MFMLTVTSPSLSLSVHHHVHMLVQSWKYFLSSFSWLFPFDLISNFQTTAMKMISDCYVALDLPAKRINQTAKNVPTLQVHTYNIYIDNI